MSGGGYQAELKGTYLPESSHQRPHQAGECHLREIGRNFTAPTGQRPHDVRVARAEAAAMHISTNLSLRV